MLYVPLTKAESTVISRFVLLSNSIKSLALLSLVTVRVNASKEFALTRSLTKFEAVFEIIVAVTVWDTLLIIIFALLALMLVSVIVTASSPRFE